MTLVVTSSGHLTETGLPREFEALTAGTLLEGARLRFIHVHGRGVRVPRHGGGVTVGRQLRGWGGRRRGGRGGSTTEGGHCVILSKKQTQQIERRTRQWP
jgi:hypothetical protein